MYKLVACILNLNLFPGFEKGPWSYQFSSADIKSGILLRDFLSLVSKDSYGLAVYKFGD